MMRRFLVLGSGRVHEWFVGDIRMNRGRRELAARRETIFAHIYARLLSCGANRIALDITQSVTYSPPSFRTFSSPLPFCPSSSRCNLSWPSRLERGCVLPSYSFPPLMNTLLL